MKLRTYAELKRARRKREAERRKPRAPIARKAKVKPVNRARKAETWARQFHSSERVEFVAALPCVVGLFCDYSQPRENHHIRARRTSDHTVIVPLCARHHRQVHVYGRESFAARWGIDWEQEAALTEQRWQRFQQQEGR